MVAFKFGTGVLITIAVGAVAVTYLTRKHGATPYDKEFDALGKKYNIPPNLLRAIAFVESRFNPKALNPADKNGNTVNYPNGTRDIGLMQINSATGAHYGYNRDQLTMPYASIECACKVLADNRRDLSQRFSPYTWAASYNVGPDLTPSDVGEAYSAKVVYNWNLYDAGRALA